MINVRIRLLVLLIIFSSSGIVAAVDPAWVLLESGKSSFEERNLSEALDFLLDAVDLVPEYPEAEYWLGRVYDAQGQPILAEEQYRRAINLSIYLRVPEDNIYYRYSLADLLLSQGQGRALEAEAILHGIADEEAASDASTLGLEHQYMKLITEKGIDELAYLYRDELTFSLKARRILGEKAWNEGRYRSSLLHSTRSVLSMLTTAADKYRVVYPDWRFDIDPTRDAENPDRDVRYPGISDGTSDLIDRVYESGEPLASWLEAEGFWPQLYLVSASLYANGFTDTAIPIWELMVETDRLSAISSARSEAGIWGRLALNQLEEPFISVGSLSP
jgi:tetratricopeptide (TPR) repeat protein